MASFNTVKDYLEEAKSNLSLRSDRALAAVLKLNATTLSLMKSEKEFPSEELMLKLARLAHGDPAEAIVVLNSRKAKSPDVRAAYEVLKKKLQVGILVLPVLLSPLLYAKDDCSIADYAKYKLCDICLLVIPSQVGVRIDPS